MMDKKPIPFVVNVILIFCVLVTAGCATSQLSGYINDMYDGRKMLMNREYQKALNLFLRANQQQSSAAALAFAGVASYRMGDIEAAEQYLNRAQVINPETDAKWLVLGYKSLVLLRQGYQAEGLLCLRAYIDVYSNLEPASHSLADLREMVGSGPVNLQYLEVLLDRQVRERYVNYNKL